MPRRKGSRAPSRAKPTLPNTSVVSVDMEAEQRKKKIDLILKDFDGQVAEKVAEMEKELKAIQESIRNLYKTDLKRYSEATRNMLWTDYIEQSKEPKVNVRSSVDSLLNSADIFLAASKPKKGRPKKGSNTDPPVPTSATKSTRSSRQKNVLGLSQAENLLPPPSTARAPRSRKINILAETPAGQGISAAHLSSMIITPKFDPRTPLPPGTIKRRPKLGEIAISLTGSPLQVSPKGWFSTLSTTDMNEETKRELAHFHERVGQLLNL